MMYRLRANSEFRNSFSTHLLKSSNIRTVGELEAEYKEFDYKFTFQSSDVEGTYSNIDYHKEEIKFLFIKYLRGEITAEQFVQKKNNPEQASKEYRQALDREQDKRRIYGKTFKNVIRKRILKKNKKNSKKSKEKIKFQRTNNYMFDVIEMVKAEPDRKRRIDAKYHIIDKINILKKFMKEKRKERLQQGSSGKFKKIYGIVLTLANSTLEKINRSNLVDFYDMAKDMGPGQLKRYSNFSVKSTRGLKEVPRKMQELDKYTEALRLGKILEQLDRGGSSYVDSIKNKFYRTTSSYFDTIRPITPQGVKEGKVKLRDLIGENEVQTEAKPAPVKQSRDTFNTINSQIRSFSRKPTNISFKKQTSIVENGMISRPGTLRRGSTFRLGSHSPVAKPSKKGGWVDKTYGYFGSTTSIADSKTNQKRRLAKGSDSNQELIYGTETNVSRTLKSAKKKFSERGKNSIFKNTFNSKLRAKRSQIELEEYEYYKEKRLLEFLSLKGGKNNRNQMRIREKLRELMRDHRHIENEKGVLLNKINEFNPLDLNKPPGTRENWEGCKVSDLLAQIK